MFFPRQTRKLSKCLWFQYVPSLQQKSDALDDYFPLGVWPVQFHQTEGAAEQGTEEATGDSSNAGLAYPKTHIPNKTHALKHTHTHMP